MIQLNDQDQINEAAMTQVTNLEIFTKFSFHSSNNVFIFKQIGGDTIKLTE